MSAVALTTLARPAHADNPAAKALFQEGQKLLASGKVDDACAKLAESDRLEPQLPVAQAHARCEKRAGRTGAALAAWRDVAARAAEAKDAAAIRAAATEIAALEKAMPKLTVGVDAATAALEGATVRVDGKPLDRSAWNTPVPVEAGKHRIEAVAKNRKPFVTEVEVAAKGDASATVPRLDDATVSKVLEVKAPTTVNAIGDARWQGGFGFVAPGLGGDDDATAASATTPPTTGGTSTEVDAPQLPHIDPLHSSKLDFTIAGGATLYESGLEQHGAVKGAFTAADAGMSLRYTHRNINWPVAPWAAIHGAAGIPIDEETGISSVFGGGARTGADYSPVHWFSVGPLLGYGLTHFSAKEGEGGTQSGPELGISTHLRTSSGKLDANIYALNRWAGDASAVYAGVNAILARPFLVYGEYRFARAGTVTAPGQTTEAFAAGLPAQARFGIGLSL